jgi:hypothetical protein
MRTSRMRVPLLALVLASVVSAPRTLGAQTIVGMVVDDVNGQPLPVASLMLLDSAGTAVSWAVSDSVGRFALRAPGFGGYRLFVDVLGYGEILTDALSLRETRPLRVEVRLQPMPLELEALVVTTERRRLRLEREGFYRRRDHSFGTFFDTEEIEALHLFRTTDILRRVPGVIVRLNREGGAVATTWSRGRACPMKVVVNGFKIDLSFGSLDDWVSPLSVVGVEVYRHGVGAPVQHAGLDASCGVVMIWTR